MKYGFLMCKQLEVLIWIDLSEHDNVLANTGRDKIEDNVFQNFRLMYIKMILRLRVIVDDNK